jgi:hypothetical protein
MRADVDDIDAVANSGEIPGEGAIALQVDDILILRGRDGCREIASITKNVDCLRGRRECCDAASQ